MQTSLKFINEQGLYRGASLDLHAVLDERTSSWPTDCELSTRMQKELVAFVLESELKLKPDTRTWLSTENLESAFGAFKQLEGQQSNGGFTSLVLPCQCCWALGRRSGVENASRQYRSNRPENGSILILAKP